MWVSSRLIKSNISTAALVRELMMFIGQIWMSLAIGSFVALQARIEKKLDEELPQE